LIGVGPRSPKYSDREWLIAMVVVTIMQFGCWFALWRTGVARAPLIGLYDIVALTGLGVALIVFFLWHLFHIYREGEVSPAKRMVRGLDGRRVLAVVMASVLAPITAGAFSAMKAAIPLVVPFYLDGPLTDFERTIFGTDAWRISHSLLGWATPLIDTFYLSWLPVILLAFNFVLLSRPSPTKTRSMIAYLLMWPVVGTVGSYILSSAGPIFHDALLGGHSGLLDALQREGAKGTLLAYNHLWIAYANRFDTLGGGISAMPSMHIGMACWLALTFRAYFPKQQWIGWTYMACIWLSSIHLGWHYATDGIGGSIGALIVWRVAKALSGLKLPTGEGHFQAEAAAVD
jgi:hypothetical protein